MSFFPFFVARHETGRDLHYVQIMTSQRILVWLLNNTELRKENRLEAVHSWHFIDTDSRNHKCRRRRHNVDRLWFSPRYQMCIRLTHGLGFFLLNYSKTSENYRNIRIRVRINPSLWASWLWSRLRRDTVLLASLKLQHWWRGWEGNSKKGIVHKKIWLLRRSKICTCMRTHSRTHARALMCKHARLRSMELAKGKWYTTWWSRSDKVV